jgi:hypothetical protein
MRLHNLGHPMSWLNLSMPLLLLKPMAQSRRGVMRAVEVQVRPLIVATPRFIRTTPRRDWPIGFKGGKGVSIWINLGITTTRGRRYTSIIRISTHIYQQDFHVAPNPKKIIQLDAPGEQGRYVRVQLLPALTLLGQGLKKSPIGKKLDFANHSYLCKGLTVTFKKNLSRPSQLLHFSKKRPATKTPLLRFLYLKINTYNLNFC